ncbi:hypothetical protein RhiirA5_430797 [Rhizophagus irregularis]|uniref:Uncharacterized protein n=1 Tax=Rhizophagus irregularis TaxID=588596 RepID=A0A2N0NW47_9GLOM|nr:hypothetical protein RhiirA5_430797 [Rhizophagus irregularis]PKC59563.1 hypothetical protein RhiirA1_469272 [Rhizophagus irregularis]
MVKNNISIEINIEKSLINIIIGYLEEDSDRKMLNNRYYVELNFMCQLIRDKTIQIEWSEFMNDKPVDDDNTTCNQDTISFSLVDLAYNIYTLRWKKNILYGDYRNYVKKINHIKYKANILTCHYLEDIFYRNELQEINWKNTFNFVQKGMSSSKRFTNICMRCESVAEDWEHIWSCDDNEKSEYEILIDTLVATEEKFKDLDEERHKIVRTLAKEIVDFMITPSNILIIGKRQMLEEIWESCYLNIRSGIWIQRCEKINEIEKGKGVTKGDKKRKRTL